MYETRWVSLQCIVITGGYQDQNNHRLNEEQTVGERKSFLAKSRVAFYASLTLRSVSLKSEVSSYVYGDIDVVASVDARIFIIQAT